MLAYSSGTARIRHAQTGEVYEVEGDELDWDVSWGDDREMGAEQFYTAVIDHPQLGQLTWTVSEYPVGAENFSETDVGPHTLLEDLRYGLGSAPDDPTNAGVDELVDWFHERYEDPANSLPYNSAEGGYQWVEGGPHDAADVLHGNFSRVDEGTIKAAVDVIEEDGITDWARRSRDDDHADYEEPDFFQDSRDFERLIEELPAQALGSQFEFKPTGKIGLTLTAPPPGEMQRVAPLIAECKDAALLLCLALVGSNAYVDLHRLVERYQAALSEDQVSIANLFAIGIRLENERQRVSASASDGELPDLPNATIGLLSSVLELHGTIIGATQTGRSLIESSTFYGQSAVTAELRRTTLSLSEALAKATELIDQDAREAIATANADIAQGPNPVRSTGNALISNRNILKVIFAGLGTVALHVALEAFAGTAAGSAAIATSTEAMNIAGVEVSKGALAAWRFMLDQLPVVKQYAAAVGGDLSWVSKLCELISLARFRWHRRKLQSEIDEDDEYE
jgi:hypothetical protein